MIVFAPELQIGDHLEAIDDLGLLSPLVVLNIGAASVRNQRSMVSVATNHGHTWLDRDNRCRITRPEHKGA